MKERKTFWDKNAGRYDRFMRKDRAAYDEMYELIRPVVKAKTVLELATGTGLIAKHIVNAEMCIRDSNNVTYPSSIIERAPCITRCIPHLILC